MPSPSVQDERPRLKPPVPYSHHLAYVLLSQIQGLVTLHGLLALANLYRWWLLGILPVILTQANVLDFGRSLDGTPLGTAFNVTTVQKIAAMLLWACTGPFEGATPFQYSLWGLCTGAARGAQYCLIVFVSNACFSQIATRTHNFIFSTLCVIIGLVFLAWELWQGIAWPSQCALGVCVTTEILTHILGQPTSSSKSMLSEDGRGYSTGHPQTHTMQESFRN